MVMRTIAMLCGCLLLAGCGSKIGPLTKDTPLCPDRAPNKDLKVVRINVNPVDKRVEPKGCYVYEGTEVGWFEETGKPFDAKFKLKSPEKWGKMKWDSNPVGSHQEAGFKAKKVDA